MLFELNQDQINIGIPDHCDLCPVALCIDLKLENEGYGNINVSVSWTEITLSPVVSSQAMRYDVSFGTPGKVVDFIKEYDKTEPCDQKDNPKIKPFSFELPIEKFLKPGYPDAVWLDVV